MKRDGGSGLFGPSMVGAVRQFGAMRDCVPGPGGPRRPLHDGPDCVPGPASPPSAWRRADGDCVPGWRPGPSGVAIALGVLAAIAVRAAGRAGGRVAERAAGRR